MAHVHVEFLVKRESDGVVVKSGIDRRVGGVDVLVL